MFAPLVNNCVIDDALLQTVSDTDESLFHFIDAMNVHSVNP